MSSHLQFDVPLPIDAVLTDLGRALAAAPNAVLVAPPGAGKTTRVPLALLDPATAPWRGDGSILVLEPRRLAARGAAARMAASLGETVGKRIGLRARLATQVGPATRIEVVTEGVFTRMILDDPALEGVAAVLFDEFHERSLDADLGLALALDAQTGLRPDLRLLVMSATLEASRVASLLGGAPVIASEGRAFPVVTHYLGRDQSRRIEDEMTAAIVRAVETETGSILAFLPGQGEILRVGERLGERRIGDTIDVAPLYGGLDANAQDRAVRPAAPGRRKIVLATSIAETSLTIEGVRVVVDSGLARVPRYEPDAGVTRLETVRASRAAVDQRRGRAGRTEPGICYRLWDEPQTQSLPAFAEPEIRAADLAGLRLDCAAWGVTDPTRLAWLDPPPAAALAAAAAELKVLGALDPDGHLTESGRRIRSLPLPPRLARMLLAAAERGAAETAAEIAALIVERGLGGRDTDIELRLASFRRDRSRRADDVRRLARGWARTARERSPVATREGSGPAPCELLALAFPERIAKARGAPGEFLIANGRGAFVDAADPLATAPCLVVAEMTGSAAATRILLAARLEEADLLALAADRIAEADEAAFDATETAVRRRRVRRLDALLLSSAPLPPAGDADTAVALATGIAKLGLDRLPWSKAQAQLRARVAFLRAAGDPGDWPELTDTALAASAHEWLAPILYGKTRLAEVTADDLAAALDALLPRKLRERLDARAPTHFTAPTGNRHAIDYDGAGAPAVHIRVQELYGVKVHPSIAEGRLPLTLHLLSPAQRPIQITRDLPGFWAGSWAAVRSEMKGRYPKHVWPEDPASALPTTRAKPRGT